VNYKYYGIEKTIDDAQAKVDELFASYDIPKHITDNNDKLTYTLAKLGGDRAARDELRQKFEAAQKELDLTAKDMADDFISMNKLTNKYITEYENQIKASEEELKNRKETLTDANIKALEDEITSLTEKRKELVGDDGKGGKIAGELALAAKLKKELAELATRIKEIDKRLEEINKRLAELDKEMENAKTPEEMEKISAERDGLISEQSSLLKEKKEKSLEQKDKKEEHNVCSQRITDISNESTELGAEITNKTSQKTKMVNDLRLLDVAEAKLKEVKDELDKQKAEYLKTLEETEKRLNDRGLNVKAERLETAIEPEEKKDEEIKEEDELIVGAPEDKKGDEKTDGKENKDGKDNKENKEDKSKVKGCAGQVFEPVSGGQPENLPVITPEQRKQANFDYIIGYTNDGIGLSSEDRLKRIQSELGGRDYEAMIKAFNELKKSPIKLTKEERKKIKEVMAEDKKHLSETLKDLDVNKLTEIFDSVGIKMDKSKVKALHGSSFEGSEILLDRIMNSKEGQSNYGIVNGFASMTSKEKGIWENVVKNYSKVKDTMPEEQKADFEKYILTPIKFGTLQAESKEVCKGPVMRFFSKIGGEDTKMVDIRSAIAQADLPKGEEISSQTKAKSFADTLKNQTVKNPPEPEMENKSGEEKGRDAR
jgi:hypothetical protein